MGTLSIYSQQFSYIRQYSHHVVHYIPDTYFIWKLVPFGHLPLISIPFFFHTC